MPYHHELSVPVTILSLPRKRESMVQHLISPTVPRGIQVGRIFPMVYMLGDWTFLMADLMDGDSR